MPCFGPLQAFYPPRTIIVLGETVPNPDRRLVFDKRKSGTGIPLLVPCGRCSGCRLEHSRQWAVRCMHEKRLHNSSAFLTLTYNNQNLPANGSLVKRDLQLFMKRYRKYAGDGVRFFACGEYGEKTNRPHYHVLLLNSDLSDRLLLKKSTDYDLYTSKKLSQLWTAGLSVVGDVTFESAAYVARYCMKKITGKKAADHYKGREPEFIVMSRRPGIGAKYFEKYQSEIINHDNIIVNGHPAALPRFYDNKLSAHFDANSPEMGLYTAMELLKLKRRRKITLAQKLDSTTRRLYIREIVAMAKLKQKARIL